MSYYGLVPYASSGVNLKFGIEIEMEGLPYVHLSHDVLTNMRAAYGKLMQLMQQRAINTTMDPCLSRTGFTKHHKDYTVWHLTQDNSIKARSPCHVTMEAVTRIMDAENPSWYHELSAFFQAVTQVMFLEYNESCGCHIHMSSWNGKFSLSQLKKIAYAVVVFEKHVFEILPESRRRNKYCKPNTTESSQLQAIFKNGRNRDSFEELADRLDDDVNSLADLKALMHDARSDSRYVLWNFNNICTTGTVEFRGGPQIRNESWTIAWAVFALAFIKLAISEDRLAERDFSYITPGGHLFAGRVEELWQRIRRCGSLMTGSYMHLPSSYRSMDETPQFLASVAPNRPYPCIGNYGGAMLTPMVTYMYGLKDED